MNIDLTQIILAIITLIGGLVARYMIPWIKGKLTERQYDMMAALIKTGVFAAEQLFNVDEGKAKFQYVQNLLRQAGYQVDDAEITALIEATVKQLKIEMTK